MGGFKDMEEIARAWSLPGIIMLAAPEHRRKESAEKDYRREGPWASI